MENKTINKKRLAKNTFMLYIRMLLVMAVTFFTTRVVLDKLGVSDYGIYNTIAGVVVMFAFLNKAMVTTTQRFLNYNLGKEDIDNVKKVFSMSLMVHVAIGIIMIVLTEALGWWFLHYKMSLPSDRYNAAFWTLQLSILITFFNIIRAPYNACIIAYEKMNFYAYISILEVILKLVIVYALSYTTFDKLILYSALLLLISVVIMLVYKFYCNHYYKISKFSFYWDKKDFYKLLNFSGFSLLGNAANMGATHGVSLVLNTFAGVIANASMGVSSQVKAGIYGFISNFQIAFNPQIIKTYARQDYDSLKKLLCQTSRFSYYLMLLLSIPIIFYCQDILSFWLKVVPEYAVSFCRWTILTTLITTLEEPLWITVQASGKIKKYQIICSFLLLLNLPFSYFLLLKGYHPVCVYISRFILNIALYLYRYYYVKRLISLDLSYYLKNLIIPILLITSSIAIVTWFIYYFNLHFFISTIMMLLVESVILVFWGVNANERKMIINMIKGKTKTKK